jgi:hypothetical protein
LYGCETWFFSLRKERRLRAFENRVPREIFWASRIEVTEKCKKLHDEDLYDLYTSPNIISPYIKNNEIGDACGTYGAEEKYTQGFGVET